MWDVGLEMSTENEAVVRRLDAIIRLLMEEQNQSGNLKRIDQLKMLSGVGLSSGEIAKILNQPSKDVSSALGKIKKTRERGQKVGAARTDKSC